jgi:hypothetical protein
LFGLERHSAHLARPRRRRRVVTAGGLEFSLGQRHHRVSTAGGHQSPRLGLAANIDVALGHLTRAKAENALKLEPSRHPVCVDEAMTLSIQ